MTKEKREMAFSIKATQEEKDVIKANAQKLGLPVVTYIRLVAMKGFK